MILGIECTAHTFGIGVVNNGKILSNIRDMYTTEKGGIIPMESAKHHKEVAEDVYKKALDEAEKQAHVHEGDISAIAISQSPGLAPCLIEGMKFAKEKAKHLNVPIIPVNHLVAHIYANWLIEKETPKFPALALVVSGGHTDLVLMKKHGEIKWIGGTRDDAAGEAFDKSARLLGLPYPGGPAISAEADKHFANDSKTKLKFFPRPMIGEDSFDWSFSGLKTAVLKETKDKKIKGKQKTAAEIQEAIVDVLVKKTLKAVEKYHPKYRINNVD